MIEIMDTPKAAIKPKKIDTAIKKVTAHFLRLNIAMKMFWGYLIPSVLIIIISAFNLSNLERLNSINTSIINRDMPLIETTDRMIDNIISEELYAHRYLILRSPEILAIFLEKGRAFDSLIEQIRSLPDIKGINLDRLSSLHSAYNGLLRKKIDHDYSSPQTKRYDKEIKGQQEKLIGLIKDISAKARREQNSKTSMTSSIGVFSFKVTALLCLVAIVLSAGAAVLITRSIAKPIYRLKLATRDIAEGRFEHMPEVKNKDELGDLAAAFGDMARRLIKLEEMYLDASPLTRLPGSMAIENVLKKRIDAGVPLAFCFIDLDNFKSFNDRYGYANGSEVIKATAGLIEKSISMHGTPDDFIGHIGGDDFVLITTPERYADICSSIIADFDSTIVEYYDREDLKKGYIIGRTRQGQETRFPIMTISIAVVTNTKRKLLSTIQVGEIAAELKDYAKSIPKSVYVVDRRRANSRVEDDAFQKKEVTP